MSIFSPSSFPPDNLTTILDSSGSIAVNTSYNNGATNNNIPLAIYIWVFE